MPAPSLFPMMIAVQAEKVVGLANDLFQYGHISKHALEVSLGDGVSVMQHAFGMALADAIAEKAVDALKAGRTLEDVGTLIFKGTEKFTNVLSAYSIHAFKAQIAANVNAPYIAQLCDHGALSTKSKQTLMAQARNAADSTPSDLDPSLPAIAAGLSNSDMLLSYAIDENQTALTKFVETFGAKPVPTIPSLSQVAERTTPSEPDRMTALYGARPQSAKFKQANDTLLARAAVSVANEKDMLALGSLFTTEVVHNDLSIKEAMYLLDEMLNAVPDLLKEDALPSKDLKEAFAKGWRGVIDDRHNKGLTTSAEKEHVEQVAEALINHLTGFTENSLTLIKKNERNQLRIGQRSM